MKTQKTLKKVAVVGIATVMTVASYFRKGVE